jgi:hypothetical protein
MEEEKERKKEVWIKDGGVEMVEKHYVWSTDVIGGPVGQLSVEIEFEKEKEENCSSSAALLEGTEKKFPADDYKEEKKEKEEVVVPLSVGNTTTSTFLVDGMSCVSPFEKEIVDQRDTLLSFIVRKQEQ